VSRGNEIDCFAALVAGAGGGLGHIIYDGENWTAGDPLGGSVKQKPACLAGPGQQITCVASQPTTPAGGTTTSTGRRGSRW
jgi:hypothetical protein